jgi:hypothetical protein
MFITNTVRSNQEKACEMRQEKKYRQFEVGERVIARDYRGKDPWVAGNISEREGPLMYKVATDKGQIWRRHTEQLKAYASYRVAIQSYSFTIIFLL